MVGLLNSADANRMKVVFYYVKRPAFFRSFKSGDKFIVRHTGNTFLSGLTRTNLGSRSFPFAVRE